jgi:hypothetical protein
VVGADDWAVGQTMRALQSAGIEALSCHDLGEAVLPCNALIKGRQCPVDAGIDAVVCVRSGTAPATSVGEFGTVCALHAGHPLILAGVATDHPLEPWAANVVATDGDLVSACLAVVRRSVP